MDEPDKRIQLIFLLLLGDDALRRDLYHGVCIAYFFLLSGSIIIFTRILLGSSI